jgi:hypothetical protein
MVEGEKTMKPLFLALIAIMAFSTTALAQGCRALPPGKAKLACIESNPIGAARLARCREEGAKMGLSSGRSGGMPGFVQACMQRGRTGN